jgi:hypothetical protein
MIARISVRQVIEGKEGVEGLPELRDDMHEAHFDDVEHFLIFVL